MLDLLKDAGDIHREVRKRVHEFLYPNIPLVELVDFIEENVKKLGGKHAFPTGVSLNNVAAHYTPNTGDKILFRREDIIKIDFGVHIDGYIIDSAFSYSLNPQHQELIESTKAATDEVIKAAGVDVLLGELGKIAEEVIGSYECEYRGKTRKIHSIKNLCGHSINRWKVHGGQTVPNIFTEGTERMKDDQCYAIETFASLGRGVVEEQGVCSHYMVQNSSEKVTLSARNLLKQLHTYQGLPFCRRWVDRDLLSNHLRPLKELVSKGYLKDYPPLVDDGPTSQHEHTIYVCDGKPVTILSA